MWRMAALISRTVQLYDAAAHLGPLADGAERWRLPASPAQLTKQRCLRSQIPETLPDEVVAKMHGPPKPDVPPVTTAHLEEADGLLLGFPTRCAACAETAANRLHLLLLQSRSNTRQTSAQHTRAATVRASRPGTPTCCKPLWSAHENIN